MDIEIVETPALGDRSYLVHDGRTAVVIDPQRDIDRILALAGRLGVRITHVAETHLHNDYVSGGLALARVTGAEYLVAAAETVAFDRVGVAGGDEVAVSDQLRLRVVATPGHTFHHLAYVILENGRPVGVCTGGSLLYGSAGRTDLLGAAHARTLAGRQHESAHRLASQLPDATAIWPTHGFGSFCSPFAPDADESTIGRERQANPALRLPAGAFVEQLLTGLGEYPAYYAHMGARNAAGAGLIDLTPVRYAGPDELRARTAAGEWVVDLRPRKAYAYRHLAGSLSFGLDGAFATWLGWLLPAGEPVTLLGDTPEQVAEAQRQLARIGVDRPAAAALPDFSAGTSLRTATFADLARVRPPYVLDVRRDDEWAAGHLEGVRHVPLPHLAERAAGLPSGEIWVHCAAGYRAAAAAGLLTRAGHHRVVLIDDDWSAAGGAGLPIVS